MLSTSLMYILGYVPLYFKCFIFYPLVLYTTHKTLMDMVLGSYKMIISGDPVLVDKSGSR